MNRETVYVRPPTEPITTRIIPPNTIQAKTESHDANEFCDWVYRGIHFECLYAAHELYAPHALNEDDYVDPMEFADDIDLDWAGLEISCCFSTPSQEVPWPSAPTSAPAGRKMSSTTKLMTRPAPPTTTAPMSALRMPATPCWTFCGSPAADMYWNAPMTKKNPATLSANPTIA